jgi:hypothetical protein
VNSAAKVAWSRCPGEIVSTSVAQWSQSVHSRNSSLSSQPPPVGRK